MILFEINDGGTHWIAAETMADAFAIAAENYGGRLAEYMEDCAPAIEAYTEPTLIVQDDRMQVDKEFERIAEPCMRIHRDNYKSLPRGLIGTTEF